MLSLRCHTISLSLSCLLLIIITISTSASAFASSGGGTVSSTITGGSLTETNSAPIINDETLDGLDQTLTITMPIAISDTTGSGDGWNVTITSTTFTTGTRSLANNATTVTAISAACHTNSTCTLPKNAVKYPLIIPADATAPGAVKLFKAASNTGMGQIDLTPTIEVALPANVYAGIYRSTIIIAIIDAP
jgi:WxL domain surface cell wall-binding